MFKTTPELSSAPFNHFLFEDLYQKKDLDILIPYLNNEAPWKRVYTPLYDQYDFSFSRVKNEEIHRIVTSPLILFRIKSKLNQIFQCKLSENIEVCAMKLEEGQGIGIHTDLSPFQESHRVIVHLSDGFDEGGNLLLFSNKNGKTELSKIINPRTNCGIAFEISENSLHAVSEMKEGSRISIVYSFYKKTY